MYMGIVTTGYSGSFFTPTICESFSDSLSSHV
jgi:hypothetical protein